MQNLVDEKSKEAFGREALSFASIVLFLSALIFVTGCATQQPYRSTALVGDEELKQKYAEEDKQTALQTSAALLEAQKALNKLQAENAALKAAAVTNQQKNERLIGFDAWPGEGCEESNFGLCQFPAEVFSLQFGRIRTKMSGWRWSSFCKTQYASDPDYGGVPNFLKCHLAVIALLNKAKELGCLEEVKDEGHFWENRNIEALIKQIGSWNEMIAAFTGKLKDLTDGTKFNVGTPITEFRNFEQLEAAGQSKLPAGMEKLAQLISQVAKPGGAVGMSVHVLTFDSAGQGHCLYTELLDLSSIGGLEIVRSSMTTLSGAIAFV